MRLPLYVYAIKHNRTGRVYIGSTWKPEVRHKNHLSLLRNHNHPVEDFQTDFDKFGDDLTFTVLEKITSYADKNREYEWMKKYRSYIRGEGYNYKDRYNFGEKPPAKRMMQVTEAERELVKIIRDCDDPVSALKTAIDVITSILETG